MLLNYLRLTFRTFLKNKTAFLINLVGMAIALGCCITAYVNWEYNSNFDRLQTNAENLYRVSFVQNTERGKVPFGVAPIPVGDLLRGSLREGDEVIQYISKDGQFRIGDELFKKNSSMPTHRSPKYFTWTNSTARSNCLTKHTC